MKKSAIMIDDWKLPIFSRHLVAAGFHYEELPGLHRKALLLHIEHEDGTQQKMAQTVLAANTEAAKTRKSRK